MTDLEASGPGAVGEPPPSYIIFLVVFLFFLTGLSGFLVCHLLKRRGYRCRTGDMDVGDEEEEEEEKLGGGADEEDEENQDTVEQILKCIIENEANMEAFNEMLGNRNVCVHHDPRLRKESIGSVPSHHHTVHSGTEHNSCHLCTQVRSKKGRRHSRTPRFKQRPGEQTVFSVGRFRVTHTDKKLHGNLAAVVGSGDLLERSGDPPGAHSGYDLRNMFKDVRPASDTTNGFVPNMGKRRKSGSVFGPRRGSDPVGLRTTEPPVGRQAGGLKLAFQKQPVVLEELVQSESPEETKEAEVPHSEESGSRSRKQEAQQSVSEPQLDRLVQPPARSLTEGHSDPGPVQTSTPTVPPPHSPPDPCSSPDLEAGLGSALAFISLGSSPRNRTPSTSSLSEAPSSPGSVACGQAITTGLSSSLTPSGLATFSQSPTSRPPTPGRRSTTQTGTRPGPGQTTPTLCPSEVEVSRGGASGQRAFSVVTVVEEGPGCGLRMSDRVKEDMVEMEDIRDCRVRPAWVEEKDEVQEEEEVQEVLNR